MSGELEDLERMLKGSNRELSLAAARGHLRRRRRLIWRVEAQDLVEEGAEVLDVASLLVGGVGVLPDSGENLRAQASEDGRVASEDVDRRGESRLSSIAAVVVDSVSERLSYSET